jgi:hypothetical protein
MRRRQPSQRQHTVELGSRFTLAADKAERPLGIMRTFSESIEKVGFEGTHIQEYKVAHRTLAKGQAVERSWRC